MDATAAAKAATSVDEAGKCSELDPLRQPVKEIDASFRARVAFFSLVAGMSVVSGFGATLMMAKRKDSAMFDKGLIGHNMTEPGARLAMRALGRGTLYAVGGCSLICYGFWKLTGAQNMNEFRAVMQSAIRTVTPEQNSRPVGRSEFSSVRELVHYLIDEDARQKSLTSNNNKPIDN